MPLSSGAKLGPYEIQSPLGAGGMGEVYRARDTRLDRSVAVKILPAHLSEKAEFAERFEREARTISSLNHPNICQLHDVGEQHGVRYLVMELLEGETLADRLRRGPMPLDQALRCGAEIAEGLEAAHRRGVVHRDLKPGNVMLTKAGAKLMDFGLAKGTSAAKPVSVELTATLTSSHATPLTQQGTIMGTFQYMSPEQIEGKEADARSDIFSLGSVLYEMISGKRAFEGKTLVSVAAAILEKEPEPIRTVQPFTPPLLERLVKKCLAKDPDARWQNSGDVASELKWIGERTASDAVGRPPASGITYHRVLLPWAVATVALIAAIALAVVHLAGHEAKPIVRTQIASSGKLEFNFVGDNGGPPVISPDGMRIVFSAHAQGKQVLFLRAMDSLTPQPISGTDNATFPFWSPDSRSIAFFADGKLKRMDVGGGPAAILCDAPIGRGGSWSSNGMILFSPQFSAPIYEVPASGGTPTAVTKLTDKYTTHRWPTALPDGQHFLYLAANHAAPTTGETAVFWASLDGKQNKLLMLTPSNAIYASGYLIFVRQNVLMAQPFDPSSGELKGQTTVLNDDVQVDASVWRGTFSASENGTMIYQPGVAGGGMQLTWFDLHGKDLGKLGAPDDYYQVELSPDGKKAAIAIGASDYVIWIYDTEHNTRTRFTFGNSVYVSPIWSRDGKQIAYMKGSYGALANQAILAKAADGSGEEHKLLDLSQIMGLQESLCDWSPDGRYILFVSGTASSQNGTDIWVLPLFGDRKPFAYIAAPGNQRYAQFSPDGRWVAYGSDESGQPEIYVAPFPWTGAKWQVSNGAGVLPRWRRDGKEIYFLTMGSPGVFAADVDGHGSSFEVGEVRTLFNVDNLSPNTAGQQYAVTGDGQRFLQITTGDAGKLPLNVIQNWTALLQGK
jgi:Tol biopolymer transport system component/tRNA A-37 threonylcarbamoyl transferase component Bud32